MSNNGNLQCGEIQPFVLSGRKFMEMSFPSGYDNIFGKNFLQFLLPKRCHHRLQNLYIFLLSTYSVRLTLILSGVHGC